MLWLLVITGMSESSFESADDRADLRPCTEKQTSADRRLFFFGPIPSMSVAAGGQSSCGWCKMRDWRRPSTTKPLSADTSNLRARATLIDIKDVSRVSKATFSAPNRVQVNNYQNGVAS